MQQALNLLSHASFHSGPTHRLLANSASLIHYYDPPWTLVSKSYKLYNRRMMKPRPKAGAKEAEVELLDESLKRLKDELGLAWPTRLPTRSRRLMDAPT